MIRKRFVLLFAFASLWGQFVSADEFQKIEEQISPIVNRLRVSFDKNLHSIERYQTVVEKECRMFPEANLFPYVLPALAYGNLGLRDPSYRDHATNAIEVYIKPAIKLFEASQLSSGISILQLSNYKGFGTELGQINLALSVYKTIGGTDSELLGINNQLNALFYDALTENQGAPIKSYPSLVWPFDTMPAIVSMLLSQPNDEAYWDAAEAHLAWLQSEGEAEPYQLPYSESHTTIKSPRGCDISLRLPLIQHFAPELAQAYYARYLKTHWSMFGFREWPVGHDQIVDFDSGPIFNGVGLSATGNGFASVIAFQDVTRSKILLSLLQQRDFWANLYHSDDRVRGIADSLFRELSVTIDTEYYSGFLYGDAALFYMLTWQDYGLTAPQR